MPEAFFYQLNGDSPESVLPRLLDMATEKGWRIELRGLSRERMERLDLALWGEGGEFRPHGLAGGPFDADQPILLTVGPGTRPRDCLVALDGAPWAHIDIAGVASLKSDSTLAPKGATGWGVMTLDRLIADRYEAKE